MTIQQCHQLSKDAFATLLTQVNANQFGELNEATLQLHFALNLHLLSLEPDQPNITMTLEKKVRRAHGVFPKKSRATANIDVFFSQDDGTRFAIELKCFHKANNREPNNRYDAYADLANLEVYLDEHADAGLFLLLTDHSHYFGEGFKEHSPNTADFTLREEHPYAAGRVLQYKTEKPYGPDLKLRNDYQFSWRNKGQVWRALLVQVDR